MKYMLCRLHIGGIGGHHYICVNGLVVVVVCIQDRPVIDGTMTCLLVVLLIWAIPLHVLAFSKYLSWLYAYGQIMTKPKNKITR